MTSTGAIADGASTEREICQYCHQQITEEDLGAHYVNCHDVRLVLDDSYWPFESEQYKQRSAARKANKGKQRLNGQPRSNGRGPSIVINEEANKRYNLFNAYSERTPKHGYKAHQQQEQDQQINQQQAHQHATRQARKPAHPRGDEA